MGNPYMNLEQGTYLTCLLELITLVDAMAMNMRILCAGEEELTRVRMLWR